MVCQLMNRMLINSKTKSLTAYLPWASVVQRISNWVTLAHLQFLWKETNTTRMSSNSWADGRRPCTTNAKILWWNFSSHGNIGRSDADLTVTSKFAHLDSFRSAPESETIFYTILVIANFVFEYPHYRYDGNRDRSEASMNDITKLAHIRLLYKNLRVR